jgi:F-type H+-transporting ATPase subunit epsilon
MSGTLELALLSPIEPDVDTRHATRVTARDASGSFAILPGHADFVAALVPCLLEWTDSVGTIHYVGVPGGILRTDGARVEVLARRHYAGASPASVPCSTTITRPATSALMAPSISARSVGSSR